MKKYLILGGNSFIGSFLISSLCKSNKVIATLRPGNHSEFYDGNVEFVQMDFVNTQDFIPYLQGVDTVIHLISTIIPKSGTNHAVDDLNRNLFPTIKLLDSMVKCGTKKIIFISSGGTVYGEQLTHTVRETHPTLPISNYGICKLMIEKYLHLYYINHGLKYQIIRLANVYGSEAKMGQTQGLIPIVVDSLLNSKPITIWGSGKKMRDYIHINDVTDAILKVDSYTGDKKLFNLGSGIGKSINYVIKTVADILDCHDYKVTYTHERNCDVESNILNIDLITRCTGWQPQISLEDGIRLLISENLQAKKY